MKKTIIKYRLYIIGIVLLTIAYFVMRLINLTNLPIFTDEAIYIRWAQIGGNDSEWRFISLVDGKQPLFVWGMMITTRIFADPLFAGRLVSVIAGFFSMIGAGLLGYELFRSKRIGMLSALLYLTYPFALMYDRMALMDSTVAMFAVWSLYLSVILVRRVRLDIALILGMSLGGGVLTKTSGFLSIYMLPAVLVLFDFKKKDWRIRLIRLLGLLGLAVLFAHIYYSILRLSSLFYMIEQKDGTFIYKYNEWITHPFRFLAGNMKGIIDWTITYITIPITLLIIGSLLTIHKKFKEKTLLFIWYIAPAFALALVGKVLYPRFIFFMTIPLLVLAAWTIDALINRTKNVLIHVALLTIILSYPFYFQSKILYSIVTAPLPVSDADQYINDWPAGWGVREAVDFLEKEATDKQIAVYTDGTFGLMPYAIEIYLVDNPNIEIIGIWPAPEKFTEEMEQDIANKPTYYIANREQELNPAWRAKELSKYKKGKKNIYLRLFQLLPENQVE